MRRLIKVTAVHLSLVCLVAVLPAMAQESQPATKPAEQAAPEQNPNREAIQKALRGYIEAFNKHDAKSLAARWTLKCVYTNRETGEQVEGRESLEADFGKFFKSHSGARLTGSLGSVRNVTPDVATAEGTATVGLPNGEPSETTFAAVFVKHGDEWLIDTVHETAVPIPSKPQDALKELEWLVGHWVDESDEVRVDTTVRWSTGKAFLLRSFVVQGTDGPEKQGTQVIGWDPRSKQIRSWSFDSDGSFGDGIWSKSGEDWLVKSTQTLANGNAAAGTYVFSKVDNDTMTVQLVGHEVEGEPRPSSDPVRVVRVKDEGSAKPKELASGLKP